ncbi:MAG: glutaminyl-tRNA synthase (glutamine-hydrolyzing) subunit B [Polaromonas sp. 39-63-203]|jgi:aspartyl-tRNA(Asn)/glutamyl-tRNA(Gln) amidotransferase subunit B|uniref:Asp-tRNA(Asn)/Glu-tRNA(Gln) amidotransferase subunit GatB n=1 Tax=Polaromonas sp. TaxID=1869339 RepID=UPI000BCCBEBB|nr:Asp-tRNA(Asn)/Glu-tRNA(Gln) amidotransferase subunit GatB [Polaromonas sp.]OYY53225.1 MAG: glutaminyl-tRNA synthase (glutamine-hydrolyzing) subunit B [Polaromonas sp. 35-63-240]OYZ00399.1 MAG: glutaminyl-tRNA synthase (glutamine-hydrolyzing) subunit B [Polaromonas sp. 28-63-22]OYZ84385.1 MAG: glutaminyl-tRNA synthase (glutamine-hydrolyzing) subunit B [Polaromonas sp. 24-62-144]OZA98621.1 MAG: glutaminyl-tRNA synthase (glutamine-hydrolyzing) subunit B [Polaromonas sp. 39-63-203]HQS31146.1 As
MSSTAASLLVQGYEVVIGFETHTQLTTQSKIFSRASTAFGAEPNTQASSVDFALPGALPVMNKGAVQRAIEFGLAVNGHIAESSVFARKNYFYPDLPKGYQISQFEIPVVQGGVVEFFLDGEKKSVRLVRAHLEEDAGKSLHEDFIGMSGIDLNRAGTPLLEIVTEPDMRSTAEAVAYAKELHKIVTWIGICDGNMQEGSFRCDANVSVRKPGAPLGTRREIKNLNSFKFMQHAMDYEVRWQINEIEEGRAVQQATVLFNPDTGETRAMRTKEDAADYRYFPDPDLPPLMIGRDWVEKTRAEMSELPRVMAARFVKDYGLPEYDAGQLTQSNAFASYFERVARASEEPKIAANWMMGEMQAKLNKAQLTIDEVQISPAVLAGLIKRVRDETITNKAAREVLEEIWNSQRWTVTADMKQTYSAKGPETISADTAPVDAIIEAKGLKSMNDNGALEKIIDDVLAANAKNVAEFRAGNAKAFNALVGQAMKATQGKANPAQVNALLKKKLG